jgi:multidrug efflux pump subunit AcrB
MLIAMAVGLVLIAALLIWQFGSFKQPFYVLVTVPLALIGVLPGLGLVGQPLSFPGLIGIVALTGIVVNNAIILIDRININRENGMVKREAVRDAAQSRLQPILLTTLTTVTGLMPLAISSATWGPLGYSIIFGLSFSTVLTLLVVPLLYLRFEKADDNLETQQTLV